MLTSSGRSFRMGILNQISYNDMNINSFPLLEEPFSGWSGILEELKKISGHEIFIYNCSPRSIDNR
jgi:hypothetical protein